MSNVPPGEMAMKVLLVTPWDVPCGISEHSAELKAAVEAADPSIQIMPDPEGLDPGVVVARERWITPGDAIVHLNYHAALHSRWTPDQIREVQELGCKVIVTYHDTGVPNSDLCKSICAAGDAAVVHEPFDDLPAEKVRYWRMGVPDWHQLPLRYDSSLPTWCGRRPILGSIGFPFPWKHYEQLALITARAGWALLLIAPTASLDQIAQWVAINPHIRVIPEFVPRELALAYLAGCDATAFTYVCHNTGQSGAILQGIAARKPVLALSTCRQFRALYQDPLGQETIDWVATFEEAEDRLRHIFLSRADPGMVALAEQDSWARLGQRYAQLYKDVLG